MLAYYTLKKRYSSIALSFCSSLFLILLFSSNSLFAQPANNDCNNASVIPIPNGGFGLGLFTSVNTDVTSATIQTGETFAPSIIVAGLNKKSVWYKFTLPTTRAARVSLAQPGSAIQNGDVGFAVYKTNTCLPANGDISTKFTPIEIFGSSFHPCVDAGDYLVQVTSNLNANGPVFITLELGEPSPALYDKPVDAYQFTNINTNKTSVVDFLVQCQTIDDAAENCMPNGSFKDFTKSTWHTFTTPAYFDWFSVLLTAMDGQSNSPDYVVGYRIYQGNSQITPVASLTLIGGCDSLKINGYYPDKKVYRCGDLLANTTYSVQLLYHKDLNKTMRLAVAWNGTAATTGPEPIIGLPTPNNMGTLNANGAGLNNTASDNLACNSRHSQHSCPKIMPAAGVLNGGNSYNLSSFFTFKLASTATLNITTNPSCGPAPLVRLYKQTVTANCTSLDTANIIAAFGYYSGPLTCLDPGDYVLQVMGVDTLSPKTSLHWSSLTTGVAAQCAINYNLGGSFNLIINAKTEVASNLFSLAAPGRFEKINANGAGVMQPLQKGITYTALPDTLGCANTVLPDGDICEAGTNRVYTKVTYREFTLADSIIFVVPGYLSSAYASKLYKGDANALAIAQSTFNYPQKITGLQPYSGCISGYSNAQNACLIPGTYTLANFDNRLGFEVTSKFSISQPITKFNTPAKAQDMGDIWQVIDPIYNIATSASDTFTCHDNPLIIDGVAACVGTWSVPATKQIYRQFYLSKPAIVSFYNYYSGNYNKNFAGTHALFSGKATDGINQLRSMGAKWTCFTNVTGSQCDAFPAGWYTVVSYGVGPTFSNPLPANPYNIQHSDVGLENGFYIRLTIACPTPKFNRPYKASIDTLTGQPYLLQWGPQPGNTAAYPITGKRYPLNVENFDCSQDTTFINTYMQRCSPANKKVSFYVFRLTQESFVQVGAMPYDFVVSMYNFDVRGADSTRLRTDPALQPCLTDGKAAEFCKLQPGIYTLVIYGSEAYSTSCLPITPNIYVDRVGVSRFDHANKAYDFGAVIPDSTWRYGKPGDVNPLDAGRAPSNDFFYCTTGAQPLDPAMAACMSKYNPEIYKAGNNIVLHPNDATAPGRYTIDRRNLWYSFTVEHAGKVRVRVQNKTPGKLYQQPFAIYKSDVNGTLPFPQVVANGAVDSTLAQGLTFITRNHTGGTTNQYCNGPEEIEFFIPPCSFIPTRYYIMVENRNPYSTNIHDMNPNSQVEIAILFDSVSARPPKFDHFSQANDMGLINSGIKQGETDNFTCATRDLSDPINYNYVTNCNKTLWYKFSTTTTGQIRYAAFFKNTNNYYYDHAQLFKQVLPNDSSSTGLKHLLYTSTYNNNGSWAQRCIEPGTYYLLLPGCNAVDEDVYPQVEIIPQAGDFCSAPMVATLNGPGTAVVPVLVDCHTIGTDYGEFNPTLTCPAGAATNQYKSSWYRLDITGTDTLDVTVFINENTNATSTDIKYRMMTGNCGAMQEQSCVQDALTRNTYKCLAPGNSYFIQVMTPLVINGVSVTGTIDLNIAAVAKADTCLPSNNCIAVANFTANFDCTTGQQVRFVNNSTFGNSVTNVWNFGYNNQTSTAVSPSFFYPALTVAQTYTVKLLINNGSCGKLDSVIQTVTIPARPAVNLGRDTVICSNGTSITLDATSHAGATYYWFNGSTQPTITVTGVNPNVWVEVTYAGCKARDTVSVLINPIARRPLQTKALCNVTQVTLDAARGFGEQFLWSTGATTSSIVVSQAGNYWVDLYWKGCFVRDSFTVISNTLAPLGNDITLCQSQLPFTANATVNGATAYSWQNNSTNSSLLINQAGLYWVDILIGGCTYRDSLLVRIDSVATINTAAAICSGQNYMLPWGTIVNSAGIYRDTVKYPSGCDSLRRIVNVTAQNFTATTANVNICGGLNYTLPWGVVVNSSGIYRDTLRYASGCDSVRRTVNLAVQNLAIASTNASICSGQNYTLPWGAIVTSAGIYRDTLRYASGCDSVRRTVNLAVQNFTSPTTNANICTGQSYTLPWGAVVTTAGIYRDTLRYATGCDSVRRTVNLIVQNFTTSTTNANLCNGQNYTLPWGTIVNSAGTYRDTLRYTSGCDSVRRTVNLAVQNLAITNTSANICSGQNYTLPWGSVVNSTGIYSDTLRYISGCDSVRRSVNLTVQNFTSTNTNAVICGGQNYVLPWGTVVTTSGMYRDTLRYITGCDSLRRTVNLTVQNFTTTTSNAGICAGLNYTLPWGTVVSAGGIYRDTLRYATGCDSVRRTVNLTVQNFSTASTNANICSGQNYTLPWGSVVNTSGIYRDTLRYITGCDSVRRIVNLTVQNYNTTTTNANICSGQNYVLPWGTVVTTSGMYRDTLRYITGCDSLRRTVNLTVQNFTTTTSNAGICAGLNYTLPWGTVVSAGGIYRDTLRYATGCDSVRRTVNLTVQNFSTASTNANICSGQNYTLPWGSVVNTSGIYRDTLRYITGCDSVRRIVNLTVQNYNTTTTNANICSGQNYVLPWGTVVTTSGMYRDTLRYITGCDSLRRIVNLTVQNFTTTMANANICAGLTYTLPWGTIVNTGGIYRDTLHYATGCDSIRRTVNLTVQNAITKSTNVNICAGQTYTLPWGTVVSNDGTYKDTLRYISGCDSIIRVIILKQQSFNVANYNVAICTGQKYTLPWGAVVNVAGVYKDTLHYVNGCDSLRRAYTIAVNPLPITAISSSNNVSCALGTSKLNAYNGAQYVWTPAISLSNPYISNPIASPTTNTMYRVTVTGANGCVAKDSILVKFDNSNSENKYLVPSAFTPNNDGKNDCFGVSYWGRVTDFSMTIFSRYGEKVFSSNNPSDCWDGTVKGVKQNTGAFIYIINANGVCGPIIRKGTVMVIR